MSLQSIEYSTIDFKTSRLGHLSQTINYPQSSAFSTIYKKHNGKFSIRELLQEEHSLNKSIETARGKINFLTTKRREQMNKTIKNQRRASLNEKRTEQKLKEKLQREKSREIQYVLKPLVERGNKTQRTKKAFELKPKPIEFQPGKNKTVIRKQRSLTPDSKPVLPIFSNFQQVQQKINRIRESRHRKQQLRRMILYSTNYHKACEVRNVKNQYEQEEIFSCQKKLLELQEKQQILLERLNFSQKLCEKSDEQLKLMKEKYDAYCIEKGLNQCLFK